jgi:PleD family two-component response regulator
MLMRLREMVKARIFDFNGIHLQIAFSAGIINSGDLPSEVTVEKMISKADERLYLAKAQGRDRIISQ